jgi:hypothetical protein
MPIQLNWLPNNTPKTGDRLDIGLELFGEDATLATTQKARIRLVELPSAPKKKGGGVAEAGNERLIATFHGTLHRDPKAPRQTNLTFDIFLGIGAGSAHDQIVMGFDPECIFGADAFVFSFVNRQFVIWFPFHIDTRSEGTMLEIQAVAEVGDIGSATEIGRSMVLNLGIHRNHVVDTTTNLSGGGTLSYTGNLTGNIILFHEDYLIEGGVRNAQSTPTAIVLDNALIPVPPSGSQVAFQPYVDGSMHILLLVDLLDDLAPTPQFLARAVKGITAATAQKAQTDTTAAFKSALPGAVQAIFVDAGFKGADVRWSDDPAAATLLSSYRGAFGLSRGKWTLRNSAAPLATSFWNFFVGSGTGLNAAGASQNVAVIPTERTVGTRKVFLNYSVPIGGGTKALTKPAEIDGSVFQDLLMTRSGLPRSYASQADFNAAVAQVAAKLTILIAHEVAHSLGLMHHCKVINGANYSEQFGSPVLSIMSSGVESGGFGIGLRFHSQAKAIWAAAFGVTPTFSDAIFLNKTWTNAQVFSMQWPDRINEFLKRHGEGSMSQPGLGAGLGNTPPFTTDPPAAPERGTFV